MHLKTLQFVLFFLFTVVESFSQNSGFGIKAGLSSTSMDFENEQIVPNDAQIGYQEGFFSRFGGEIFVQPELLFTQTRGRFTINFTGQSEGEKFKASFNRLDIPVLVGFRLFNVVRLMAGEVNYFSGNITNILSKV